MSLLTPDLTGQNAACRKTNDARMVIKQNQVIEFHDSVFADSIEMILVANLNVTKYLVKGIDWEIMESDIDYEAMSAMRLREPTFLAPLVKSITMIRSYVSDYKVSMNYQTLYPLPSTLALQNYPDKVEFTPESWIEVLEAVKRHELLLAPIRDIHADGIIKQPMMLEPDPHQERLANRIVDEIYELNVPNKLSVVHPIHGPFFKDTLSIRTVKISADGGVSYGDILIEGTDYKIYGFDAYKTANTPNSSGVYKYILFTTAIVGNVAISYHAYGGDPTLYDIKAHNESINNLTTYILDSQLLTAETVANAPVVINMINKLTSLEEEMRILAQQGRPNYGDATNGNTLLKVVTTSSPKEIHWWTIAELYKVAGSEEVFVSGTMKLNIQMLYKKMAFTTYVSVNLDNTFTNTESGITYQVCDALKVSCPISQVPLGYEPFSEYSGLDNLSRPQFRIIWNKNAVENSGIYLQIGMRLNDVVTESIAVEDMSGNESCWKLIPSPAEAVGPEDDIILLPSKNHTWSIDNVDSKQESYLIPFVDGHIIWAGTQELNRPQSGRKDISLIHFLEDEIDISRVRKLRFDLEEVGANKFPVFMDVIPGSEDLLGSTSFYYNGKPAYMTGRLRVNPATRETELSVGVDITAGLSSNQLNLRHVVIYT